MCQVGILRRSQYTTRARVVRTSSSIDPVTSWGSRNTGIEVHTVDVRGNASDEQPVDGAPPDQLDGHGSFEVAGREMRCRGCEPGCRAVTGIDVDERHETDLVNFIALFGFNEPLFWDARRAATAGITGGWCQVR